LGQTTQDAGKHHLGNPRLLSWQHVSRKTTDPCFSGFFYF